MKNSSKLLLLVAAIISTPACFIDMKTLPYYIQFAWYVAMLATFVLFVCHWFNAVDTWLYYRKHPCAKLIDDCIAQGKLAKGEIDVIFDRVSKSEDAAREIKLIREEKQL